MRSIGRMIPDCSRSIHPFIEQLYRTVAWAIERANPANPSTCLRDLSYRPRTLAPDYFEAVSSVLRPAHPGQTMTPGSLEGGRLMVYFPDAQLSDGAAEEETGGFFDVFNTPPWDTWVAFARDVAEPTDTYAHYLIAYIPPAFVEICTRGIYVNPEECIAWIEHTEVGVHALVRRHAPDLLWRG